MNVKHIFERRDFLGSGQLLVRNSHKSGSDNADFLTTVAYQIGYVVGDVERRNTMTSLSDGCVIRFSMDELLDHLNNDEEGYRPATKDELRQIVEYQGNRFLGRG